MYTTICERVFSLQTGVRDPVLRALAWSYCPSLMIHSCWWGSVWAVMSECFIMPWAVYPAHHPSSQYGTSLWFLVLITPINHISMLCYTLRDGWV